MGRCLSFPRILRLVVALPTLFLCPVTNPPPNFFYSKAAQYLAPCSITISNSSSTRYLTARDGARIHYKVKGNPKARQTLVFLHGFAADAFSWLEVLEKNPRLLFDYRVILITFRGHGKGKRYSELGKVEPEQYYQAIVQDIQDILRVEKVSSAILIGHSMGGEIARYYYAAIRHPVKALVLISTFCRFPLSGNWILRAFKLDAAVVGAARALLRIPRLHGVLDWYKKNIAGEALLGPFRSWVRYFSNGILFVDVDAKDFDEEYLPVALSTSFKAYLLGLEAMGANLNGSSRIPVAVPALIIHGNGDRLVWPIEAKLLQEQIPTAEVHYCEGRHFPHLDPYHFPRILNRFLDSLLTESSC